jgi:hypothetical protein
MGNAPPYGGGKIKARLTARLKPQPSLRRVQNVRGALCRTLYVIVHQEATIL